MSGARPGGPESNSIAGSDPLARSLIQRLEELRQRVLDRLDSLETLARDRRASAPGLEGEVSEALELKQAALEEREHRLEANAKRREKEWAASLAQLEADRHLLAEAWESIEQERVASASGVMVHPQTHFHGQTHGLQRAALAAHSHAAATAIPRSAAAESEPNHSRDAAILRQFQTLCSDVRRNAEDRRDSHAQGRGQES
jgi:hypothetical protein